MDGYKLQQLCIDNNWFTSGTNAQYDKLFDMQESGKFSIHEMALVIWCCTPDVEIVDIETILAQSDADAKAIRRERGIVEVSNCWKEI